MSGECDKCSEHTIDCKCKDLTNGMIEAVIRLGKAQQYLNSILKYDLFAYLEDIPQPIRCKVSCVNDDLWHLYNILRGEYDN